MGLGEQEYEVMFQLKIQGSIAIQEWTNLPDHVIAVKPKEKKVDKWKVDNCLVLFPKGCAKVKYPHCYQG